LGELRAADVTAVHVVVPDGIDDPTRPSGGNAYDRHVCRGLASLGWSVREHAVPGPWPRPDPPSSAALEGVLRPLPDGAVVLLDGLVASPSPEVLVAHAGRLRLVVLVHMPLGHRPEGGPAEVIRNREQAVLSAAAAIVTTSRWSRNRLLGLYRLRSEAVQVAEPGVAAAELAAGTDGGGMFLCVAAVIPEKGHDVLLGALQTVSDLPWQCACVGRLDRDPPFVQSIRRLSVEAGVDDRVHLLGPRAGAELDRCYAGADLMVLASRAETYGMVITEALARGLPVVATDVGGVPEALGSGADGARPGLLVAPDDPAAVGAALRAWLGDAELRRRLRRAGRARRESLPSWSTTAASVARVLAGVLG
jgi:glycosyltransferase involved in cell wall biosynthesis